MISTAPGTVRSVASVYSKPCVAFARLTVPGGGFPGMPSSDICGINRRHSLSRTAWKWKLRRAWHADLRVSLWSQPLAAVSGAWGLAGKLWTQLDLTKCALLSYFLKYLWLDSIQNAQELGEKKVILYTGWFYCPRVKRLKSFQFPHWKDTVSHE